MAWFALDVDDYDADTMHLSAAEDGVYGRLMRFYYKTRMPLPDDDRALAGISRITPQEFSPMRATIRAFFKQRSGKLHHKRIDAELDKEDKLAKFRSERSKNAATKRWATASGLDANSIPQAQPENAQAMPENATTPHHTTERDSLAKNASFSTQSYLESSLSEKDGKKLNGHSGINGNGSGLTHRTGIILPFKPVSLFCPAETMVNDGR